MMVEKVGSPLLVQ